MIWPVDGVAGFESRHLSGPVSRCPTEFSDITSRRKPAFLEFDSLLQRDGQELGISLTSGNNHCCSCLSFGRGGGGGQGYILRCCLRLGRCLCLGRRLSQGRCLSLRRGLRLRNSWLSCGSRRSYGDGIPTPIPSRRRGG